MCCNLFWSSLGNVDVNTLKKVIKELTEEEKERRQRATLRPLLTEILNLHDFEVCLSLFFANFITQIYPTKAIAKLVMPEKAWAYYSAGADDEITMRENHLAYHRYNYSSAIYAFINSTVVSGLGLACSVMSPT